MSNVGPFAGGLVGLSEKEADNRDADHSSGSSQTSPTYWLNPKTGGSYPVSIHAPTEHLHTMTI